MAIAELYGHPENPVPSKPSVWLATTTDGVSLRMARWRPTTRRAKGTVLVAQGRAEFIERYFETISELRRRGFHVITFDWRGQGGSDRLTRNPRKGHVGSLAHYRSDLATVVSEMKARMPEPHFALAHSMGGALLLDAAMHKVLPVARLVVVAPMVGLELVKNQLAVRSLTALLYWTGFGQSFVPGGGETAIATLPFEGNRLTSDPVRYARNADVSASAPHLAIGAPTIGWMRMAFKLMDILQNAAAPLSVRQPVLVLAAGDDPIVSTPAVERFAARLKTGSALIIPKARHEILMETDAIRARFWAAFDAFVPGEPGSAVEKPQGRIVDPAVT